MRPAILMRGSIPAPRTSLLPMRVHNLDVRCKPVLFAQNETIFTRSTNLSPLH